MSPVSIGEVSLFISCPQPRNPVDRFAEGELSQLPPTFLYPQGVDDPGAHMLHPQPLPGLHDGGVGPGHILPGGGSRERGRGGLQGGVDLPAQLPGVADPDGKAGRSPSNTHLNKQYTSTPTT